MSETLYRCKFCGEDVLLKQEIINALEYWNMSIPFLHFMQKTFNDIMRNEK